MNDIYEYKFKMVPNALKHRIKSFIWMMKVLTHYRNVSWDEAKIEYETNHIDHVWTVYRECTVAENKKIWDEIGEILIRHPNIKVLIVNTLFFSRWRERHAEEIERMKELYDSCFKEGKEHYDREDLFSLYNGIVFFKTVII